MLNRNNEETRGELKSAATAVLLAAEVAQDHECSEAHQLLNTHINDEFRRQLGNLLRENATDYTHVSWDVFMMDIEKGHIPEVLLIHLARLVTFLTEGFMPGRKDR